MLLCPFSTVLAQDHFYNDFLSLLLAKKIHFESVRMMAFAHHSLSVLTSVKLMIERAVHLLSSFLCKSFVKLKCGFGLFGGFWERATSEELLSYGGTVIAPLPHPSHNPPFCSQACNARFCSKVLYLVRFSWAVTKAPLVFCMHSNFAGSHQFDHTFSAFWL